MTKSLSDHKALIVSAVFGVMMFLVGILIVWRNLGSDFYNNSTIRSDTGSTMRTLATGVERYRIDHGRPPLSFDQALDNYSVADSYGGEIMYQTDGSSYTITSYARDKKAGGSSYDADIIWREGGERDPDPELHDREAPGFLQFWKMPVAKMPFRACLLTGALSFILSMLAIWRKPISIDHLGRFLLITFGAVIMVWFLSAAHIPNGH